MSHLPSLSIIALNRKMRLVAPFIVLHGIILRIKCVMWKSFVNRESMMQIWALYQRLEGVLLYLQRMRILFSHVLSPRPHILQREQKGACFQGPGGSLGFMYALCPLARKHRSSRVEKIGREITGDLIQSEVLFECGFCASLK